MMATLRFGQPTADHDQQVVLDARWGGPSASPRTAWRDTFVYGIAVTSTAFPATMRTFAGSATESIQLDTTPNRTKALTHAESGIRPNGFNAVAFWNGSSASTGWATDLEAIGGNRPWLIQGILDDVDGEWLALNDAAAAAGNITTVLTTPLGRYTSHPSVLAYTLADDLTNDAVHGRRANELMAAVPTIDAHGRPATPSFLGSTADAQVASATWQIGLFGAGGYPSRWTSTGVKRAEGDFTHAADPSTDWGDWVRAKVLELPATANVWWWLQAHQLGTGSVPTNDLSYPTAREIRKQVWEAVGGGARGFLWFLYQDDADTSQWLGLAHPSSAARMRAVQEMSNRLTPNIRRRLMTARPTVANTEFTAIGGGSAAWTNATYANAYVGTLQDGVTGTYYVVVCNRSTSTASVLLSSTVVSGHLVNLETGRSYLIGNDAVSLGPLDGTIFRVVPQSFLGVPNHLLVQADDDAHTAESWWAQHWMNPASSNYQAAGAIPTHANEVVVPDGDDLQAAIDAAPDNTTFVLEAGGTYCLVDIVGRNGMHFVTDSPDSDDPDLQTNWATLYGINLLGHEKAREYHWSDGWVAAIIEPERDGDFDAPLQDLTAIAAFTNPPRDYLFRHIRFTQEPGTMVDQVYETRLGTRELHNPKHAPFYASGVRDVLCEFCVWEGYDHSDNDGIHGGTTPLEFTHPGFIYASGGVEGIWIRNCKVDVTPTVSVIGFPFYVYFDGPQNCCLYDNDFVGGAAGFVSLTNWDVRNDWNHNGNNMEIREWRQPRFQMVVNNRFFGGRLLWTNRNPHKCLIAENDWTYVGLRHCFAEIQAEDTSDNDLPNATTDLVIRDNVCDGDDVGDSSGSGFVHMQLSGSYLVTDLVITGNSVTKPPIYGTDTVPNGWLTAQEDSGGLPASYTISGNDPP